MSLGHDIIEIGLEGSLPSGVTNLSRIHSTRISSGTRRVGISATEARKIKRAMRANFGADHAWVSNRHRHQISDRRHRGDGYQRTLGRQILDGHARRGYQSFRGPISNQFLIDGNFRQVIIGIQAVKFRQALAHRVSTIRRPVSN